MNAAFPWTGLIEISGVPGSGKTQWSMQLALDWLATGGNRPLLVIDTDGGWTEERLALMAQFQSSSSSDSELTNMLDRVDYYRLHSPEQVLSLLLGIRECYPGVCP
jgi:hypothetical protein